MAVNGGDRSLVDLEADASTEAATGHPRRRHCQSVVGDDGARNVDLDLGEDPGVDEAT
jgi:hypothetical protein